MSMVSKNKYIIIFCLVFVFAKHDLRSQIELVPVANGFKEYKKIFLDGIEYYSDSIKKNRTWVVYLAYLKDFDTLDKKLKFISHCSFYNPIPTFNPTHYVELNKAIFLIKFDKKINPDIVRRFGFNIINDEFLLRMNKEIEKKRKGVSINGYFQSFVYEFNDNNANTRWYQHPLKAPSEDNLIDLEYINNGVKYNQFLKTKLKEYGYEVK